MLAVIRAQLLADVLDALAAEGVAAVVEDHAAEQFGQTVVGFLRNGRFNVYTRPDRVDVAA